MKSQTFFDLTEPFFMVVLHTEKGQVCLFQNLVTVNRFVRDQHPRTYVSLHWVRVVGHQVTTSALWHGNAEDYGDFDRAWKDEPDSMCKSKRWQDDDEERRKK